MYSSVPTWLCQRFVRCVGWWSVMARFKASTPAVTPGHQDDGNKLPPSPNAVMPRPVVSELPLPKDCDRERYERLLAIRVRSVDSGIGKAAVESAARVRCLLPFTCESTDRNAASLIARFLVAEASVVGVVDARRTFRRANVDRYLTERARRRTERSLRECRNVLYAAGRVLHPREYPAARVLPAPRFKRQEAASMHRVQALYALVPGLPASLSRRLEVLVDLAYGAGARPADLKTLRGSAISSVRHEGRDLTVVTLPNLGGGTRQVPVFDAVIGSRIADHANHVGDGLLLTPGRDEAERNAPNRISEHLRRLGYGGVSVTALRNRWVLDLAERVPAALLVQLADVVDARVLADQRGQLPTYSLHHSVSVMGEVRR